MPGMQPAFSPELSLRQYGPSPGSHAHAHFQILWGLEGCLELDIEGRGTRIDAGTGLVIAPGERHDFEAPHSSRCLVLDTRSALWASRSRIPVWAQAVQPLALFLAGVVQQRLPIATAPALHLLAQAWGGGGSHARAQRAIDWAQLAHWVQQRLHAPLTAADLAQRACLSESQFRARCLAAQGCSPMQWVRQLRLEQALQLRAAGLGVATVAQQVGYASPSALTAALRRTHPRQAVYEYDPENGRTVRPEPVKGQKGQ